MVVTEKGHGALYCKSACIICDGDSVVPYLIDKLAMEFQSDQRSKREHYPIWRDSQKKGRRGNWAWCFPVEQLRARAIKSGLALRYLDEWMSIETVCLPPRPKGTDCYIYPLTPDRYFDIEKMKERK